jgi:hypothetical protein
MPAADIRWPVEGEYMRIALRFKTAPDDDQPKAASNEGKRRFTV